jgi:hypothetical protein
MRFGRLTLVTIVVFFVLICTSTSRGQGRGEAKVEALRLQVLELISRVEVLEAEVVELRSQLTELSSPGAQEGVDREDDVARVERVMILEGYEPLPPDRSNDAKLKSLRTVVAERQRMAEAADQKALKLKADPLPPMPHHHHTGGKCRFCQQWKKEAELNRSRAIADLKKEAVKFRSEAKAVEGDAKKIERKAAEPRHKLTGLQAGRRVVLLTTRNLSASIEKLTVGTCVEWKGRCTERNDMDETWDIIRIAPGACP